MLPSSRRRRSSNDLPARGLSSEPSGSRATGIGTLLRAEFVWMGGVWQVPPPGTIWVGSRWMRDGDGWYRRPGFWSRRRGPGAVATTFSDARSPAWRMTGPPADHPADKVADAPGPDYFFIPGHYAPTAISSCGNRDSGRCGTARLGLDSGPLGPALVRLGVPGRPLGPRTGCRRRERDRRRPADRPRGHAGSVQDGDDPDIRPSINAAATAGTEDESDPIARAEAAGRVRVVVPGIGMPYYVIRPPGLYPYGPGGVDCPGRGPAVREAHSGQVLP